MKENTSLVSLYVVKCQDGSYFAGYNTEKGKSEFVEDVRFAKKFSNKNDIKLRPEEMLIEITVDLSTVDFGMSEPFRPIRKFIRN